MEIVFRALRERDIPQLAAMMKNAFEPDGDNPSGSLEEDTDSSNEKEFLVKAGLDRRTSSYCLRLNNKTIGAVILWIDPKTEENYLGTLFLDREYQNQGFGQIIWNAIERQFPNTRVWRTEAPAIARRAHYFFVTKCGFHIVRIDNPSNPAGCCYLFEKRNAPSYPVRSGESLTKKQERTEEEPVPAL